MSELEELRIWKRKALQFLEQINGIITDTWIRLGNGHGEKYVTLEEVVDRVVLREDDGVIDDE